MTPASDYSVLWMDNPHELKDAIKTKKAQEFDDIDADKLTLWRVSIPDAIDAASPAIESERTLSNKETEME
ncbi:hypothetical protein BGX24_011312 [Mortierella sp. AD032]|nr:hypothetical protein BGX24_011312 [Mortierella sp. AD032]